MKRREFVKTMAAGAAASASGCAGLGLGRLIPGAEMSMAAMDRFLGRFDSGLLAIAQGSMFDEVTAVVGREHAERRRARFEHAEEMGKRAMRSLYVAGMFRDLPEEARLHPGVQERMWRAAPEMEQSVHEMTETLDNLPEEKRMRIKRLLEERPDAVAGIGEAIDRRASEANIPLKRRLHLRRMMFEVGGRLRHSPTLVIDEYVDKVRRVEAWSGDQAEIRRRLVARYGEDYLWQLEKRSEEIRRGWQAGNYPSYPGPDDYKTNDGPNPAVVTGLVVMGLGIVVLATSGIVASRGGGMGGAYGMTAGGILVLIGIIVAVVGARD